MNQQHYQELHVEVASLRGNAMTLEGIARHFRVLGLMEPTARRLEEQVAQINRSADNIDRVLGEHLGEFFKQTEEASHNMVMAALAVACIEKP